MSYIRALSNPEGLYIWGEEDPKNPKRARVVIAGPTVGGKPLPTIPSGTFKMLCRKWNTDGEATYKGFVVDEVVVCGKKVKRPGQDDWHCKKEHEYKIRLRKLGKGGWYMLMWRVTWEYVVENVSRRP